MYNEIPSEAKLDFTLKGPLTVTLSHDPRNRTGQLDLLEKGEGVEGLSQASAYLV